MNKLTIGLIATALVASAPSYAFLDSLNQITETANSVTNSMGLIDSLTDQLGVSKTQATGGVGALLAMASSNLGGTETNELSSLLSSLAGSSDTISNMAGVQSAFEALGLDANMISQFTPIILEYLGGQGASSSLLGSLGKLWG